MKKTEVRCYDYVSFLFYDLTRSQDIQTHQYYGMDYCIDKFHKYISQNKFIHSKITMNFELASK